MSRTINVLPSASPFSEISEDACRAMLERTCFGHLVLVRQTRVDALPIRFAFVDTWLYFRADHALRHALGHNAWVAILISESFDKTRMTSVVARGGCYPTKRTGSADGDAAALRGIIRLRDRVPMGITRAQWVERSTTVFRMHVDELRGRTGGAPSPADLGAPPPWLMPTLEHV